MDSLHAQCACIVDHLVDRKIRFLAIDFDNTLISFHTDETDWKGSSEALAKDVRPVFLALIPLAMERKISVAIVTFSRKVDMIRSVLRVCFPDLADSIPVRGCDDTSKLAPVCNQLGKQSHMALAVEWLTEKSPTLEISRNSTLLIDDDSKNVRAALKEKVRAILFNPQDLDRTVANLLQFV